MTITAEELDPFGSDRKENKILRLISQDKKVIIKACDGTQTLANAKNVFRSGIDPDFKNWGLDNSSAATVETVAEVYELIKDANFVRMFKSFDIDLDKLCLNQNQIKDFCVENSEWLRKGGYGNFFLFRKDEKKPATPENLFVAYVGVHGDGLYVYVNRFEYDLVWNAELRRRVVLPQLTV